MLDILDLSVSLKSIKDTKLADAIAATGVWGSTQMAAVKAKLDCFACNPACWSCIFPQLTTCTGSLCVYDQSGYFRCGASCTWTVPAGATKAKFEIWGAGSGSGAGRCCGGYPPAATGAYGTIIIPVTAGCQYTLCAGCAHSTQSYCVYCCDLSGCKSFVTGYGLTNFCAEGGCFDLYRRQKIMNRLCNGNTGDAEFTTYKTPNTSYQGSCVGTSICGGNSSQFGSYLCQPGSWGSCDCIPIMPDCQRSFNGTPFGYASILGGSCWDTNYYGFDIMAPTLAANDGVTSCIGCCCFTWSSGTCCGSRNMACDGQRCVPGAGGTPTHIMGGNTELYGDWGRTGMVKVSWV